MRRPARPASRHPLAVAAIAVLVLGACSRRDRTNPFDPSNPITQGRPTGFNAFAGFASVKLQWDPRPGTGLDGFLLARRDHPDSAFRDMGGVLPPTATQFLDAAVSNGVRYAYRLYYVRDGVATSTPAEDQATPGSMLPWVADEGFDRPGAVLRLSPDGRDIVAAFEDFEAPTSLAVDGVTTQVWIAEPDLGRLSVLTPSTGAVQSVRPVGSPFTIALDPANGNGWVCDLEGSLRHFTPAGSPVTPGQISLLQSPGGVAVWPADRSVWVCERDGDRVRRFDVNGVPLSSTPVFSPSRVAVDSATGRAFVTSLAAGRVVSVLPGGAALDTSVAASGPIGVAVDHRRGVAWVADALGNQLLGLRTGDLAVVHRVTGLPGVRDVAVDVATGEVWAVVNGTGEVWRLSAAGAPLDKVGGFLNPLEVRLDTGAR